APPALSASASATFAFSTGEDATFECRLDGGAPAPCASPVTYEGLADGEHTFEVAAIDTFSNRDEVPATHTWTIDTLAPATTLDAAPGALVTDASATFSFTSDDPAAAFECELDGD